MKNAENVLVIENNDLVKRYYNNWLRRLSRSVITKKYMQENHIN